MAWQEFFDWHNLKKSLDVGKRLPTFKEREIWWCSIGKNIGHEEDGKNQRFHRPVLIIKKFNRRLFWGVPLTTKIKENKHYYLFNFDEKKQAAMLTQMRLWDASRIERKIGRLNGLYFDEIKARLANYLK